MAALVFDYRGFGDSTGEPDLFEPERQLDDWRAAVAFARKLPHIGLPNGRNNQRRIGG